MDLTIFGNVAILILDSCSSNLLTASQVQNLVSVRRMDLPTSGLGDESARIVDIPINTTALHLEVEHVCSLDTEGEQTPCTIIRELLEIVESPSIEARNETLRNLARFIVSGERTPDQFLFDAAHARRTALDTLMIPLTSRECLSISPVLSAERVIHLSPWASSTTFNNINEYPYFFRTAPSDDQLVAAISDLLMDLDFQYLSFIVGEDEIYSGQGFGQLTNRLFEEDRLCIGILNRISAANPLSLHQAARAIQDQPRPIVIVIYATLEQVTAFIPVYDLYNISHHIIVGSSDWFARLDYSRVPKGSAFDRASKIGFVPAPQHLFLPIASGIRMYEEALKMPQFIEYAARENPFVRLYLELVGNCTFPPNLPCQQPSAETSSRECPRNMALSDEEEMTIAPVFLFMLQTLLEVVLDSTYAQPYCYNDTCRVIGSTAPNEEVLFAMRSANYPCTPLNGTNRTCNVFTSQQSGYPYFELQQIQRQEGTQRIRHIGIADWDVERGLAHDTRLDWYSDQCINLGGGGCVNLRQRQKVRRSGGGGSQSYLGREYFPFTACSAPCPAGTSRQFGSNPANLCCWTCTACNVDHVSITENSMVCQTCPTGMVPNINRSACMLPFIAHRAWPGAYTWLLAVISSVGGIMSIFFLCFFYLHRKEALILKSNIHHMTFIILSSIALYLVTPIVMLVSPDSNARCHILRTLVLFITTLSILSVLFKTNRLKKIFNSTTILGGRKHMMKFLSTGGQLTLISVFSVLIAVVYMGMRLELNSRSDLQFIDERTAAYYCRDDLATSIAVIAFLIVLSIVACILAFQTRNLPNEYNDSKLVLISSASSGAVFISSIPAAISSDALSSTVILLLLNNLYHIAVVTALCAPRIYWSKFGFTENYTAPRNNRDHPSYQQRAITDSDKKPPCTIENSAGMHSRSDNASDDASQCSSQEKEPEHTQ